MNIKMIKHIQDKVVGGIAVVISGTAASYYFLGSSVYATLVGIALLIVLTIAIKSLSSKTAKFEAARSKIASAGISGTAEFRHNPEYQAASHDTVKVQTAQQKLNLEPEHFRALAALDLNWNDNPSVTCVRRAFHKKVRDFHPDLHTDISQEIATQNISYLKEAKKVCIDLIQRSDHV